MISSFSPPVPVLCLDRLLSPEQWSLISCLLAFQILAESFPECLVLWPYAVPSAGNQKMNKPSWRSSHPLIYTVTIPIETGNFLRAEMVSYSPATITLSLVNSRQSIFIKKKEKSGLREAFSCCKIYYLLVLILLLKLNSVYPIKIHPFSTAKPLYRLSHIP